MEDKINRQILRAELSLDEGFRATVYKDTVGKHTIGIGRNLDDVGIRPAEQEKLGITARQLLAGTPITRSQALILLEYDIETAESALDHALPWWRSIDPVRQRVLVNMTFNMGIKKLLAFKNTLRAIQEHRYADAAAGMRNSLWAKQVGDRATRLERLMLLGPQVN